ncbi:hypothetical protein Misp02_02720 [Microtetraspora sp. NBRC 16547]|nr:hypothetical protein Misp02_02720 [Microtetraspora sp. NBRC 16547]
MIIFDSQDFHRRTAGRGQAGDHALLLAVWWNAIGLFSAPGYRFDDAVFLDVPGIAWRRMRRRLSPGVHDAGRVFLTYGVEGVDAPTARFDGARRGSF